MLSDRLRWRLVALSTAAALPGPFIVLEYKSVLGLLIFGAGTIAMVALLPTHEGDR